MSRSQPDLARPSASMPARRRRLAALAWLLACCAVVASAGWVPAMVAAAHALRPHQLDHAGSYRDAAPAVAEPKLLMWIIAIASFLVIVALAVMALLVGRRALRMTRASVLSLARLERGAVASLAGGLVIWLVPFFLDAADRYFSLPEGVSVQLASIALAGAVGSFILGGIAVRQVAAGPEQAAAHRRAWYTGARICLAVAPVIILTLFLGTAIDAQIIVGFFLHLVF